VRSSEQRIQSCRRSQSALAYSYISVRQDELRPGIRLITARHRSQPRAKLHELKNGLPTSPSGAASNQRSGYCKFVIFKRRKTARLLAGCLSVEKVLRR